MPRIAMLAAGAAALLTAACADSETASGVSVQSGYAARTNCPQVAGREAPSGATERAAWRQAERTCLGRLAWEQNTFLFNDLTRSNR